MDTKKQTEKFKYNDGGRSDAGYKGKTGDCVTRAIAIATGRPYQEIYDRLAKGNATQRSSKHDRKSKAGVETASRGINTSRKWFKQTMNELGFTWTPTMLIGQGCKVHLKADELPKGRLVVAVSKHYVAVIDGVINDTYEDDRNGTRCVYGYYTLTPQTPAPTHTDDRTDDNDNQPEGEDQPTEKTPQKQRRAGMTDGEKLERVVATLDRWQSKLARAQRRVRKLTKQMKYYRKKIRNKK